MSEDRAEYRDSLDKVIEGNNNIFERLNVLENKMTAMISLYRDAIIDNGKLEQRVRELEKVLTSYPMESEIKNIKVGLND